MLKIWGVDSFKLFKVWLYLLKSKILKHPRLTRWILAGPITIFSSLLIIAGMALWFPPGSAKVNNLALPVVFIPIIWAICFFYVCLEEVLHRAVLVMSFLMISQVLLLFLI